MRSGNEFQRAAALVDDRSGAVGFGDVFSELRIECLAEFAHGLDGFGRRVGTAHNLSEFGGRVAEQSADLFNAGNHVVVGGTVTVGFGGEAQLAAELVEPDAHEGDDDGGERPVKHSLKPRLADELCEAETHDCAQCGDTSKGAGIEVDEGDRGGDADGGSDAEPEDSLFALGVLEVGDLLGLGGDGLRILTRVAPITLSAGFSVTQIAAGGGYAQLNQSGSYGAYIGLEVMVFGAYPSSSLSDSPISRTLVRSIGIPTALGDGMWWIDANNRASYRAGAVTYLIPSVQDSRVSSQFNKTDATLANVTGLTANVIAAKVYRFKAQLFVDADAVGGYQVAIAGTATATAIIYQTRAINNATGLFTITDRKTALAGASSSTTGTALLIEIEGTITVNAAGTLTVQFAQSTANGTSSVLVGSTFAVTQIT